MTAVLDKRLGVDIANCSRINGKRRDPRSCLGTKRGAACLLFDEESSFTCKAAADD